MHLTLISEIRGHYNCVLKMTVRSSTPRPIARPRSSPSRQAAEHVTTQTTCKQTPMAVKR